MYSSHLISTDTRGGIGEQTSTLNQKKSDISLDDHKETNPVEILVTLSSRRRSRQGGIVTEMAVNTSKPILDAVAPDSGD